ncbi:TIGR02301 family protein [Stappia sp.]|uniref:TIGR02301 family protein n=1 Tax=Stappia sp. TaxID=1870903 RepID=UPI003D0CC02C
MTPRFPFPLPASRRFAPLLCRAVLATALLMSGQALAQDAARGEDPPYEADLMRLSEILGALHYLRPLCGSSDGSLWRDQMQSLLDAEVQDDERERRFIERFNQGYRGFSSVYRRCTPAAQEALARYIDEGGALIRNVTTRYNR